MRALFLSLFLSTNVFADVVKDFSLSWENKGPTDPEVFDSSKFNDAIYVIEAYFLNCPYCNNNAQNVNQLAADVASDSKVKVLDVSRDCSKGYYKEWIARHEPNHPVLNDCRMSLLGQLHVTSYPTTVILDCKLKPVYRHGGEWSLNDRDQMKGIILNLLNSGCTR